MSNNDDISKHMAAGSLVPLDDFLATHAAFFEAHGYKVRKTIVYMEFTRLSDSHTIKIPMMFNVVAADQTRENFLADIESTFLEADEENND